MQRILLLTLLAGAFAPAGAAQVTLRDTVEVSAPDGSARAQSIALLDDGTSVLSARGPLGDRAIIRLNPGGQETNRWLVPRTMILGDPFQPVLRDDGAVAFFARTDGTAALHAIDFDGQALPPFAFAGGLSPQGRPFFLPGGFVAAVYTGSATQLHAYTDGGALRATYVPAPLPPAVGVHPTVDSVLADGGVLVHELHSFDGASRAVLRRLDAALGLQWTQDFSAVPGSHPSPPTIIEGPGEQRLAIFKEGGFGSGKATLVVLDAGGAITGQAVTPAAGGYHTMFLTGHGTATGFELFGLRYDSGFGLPPCRYEASIGFAGALTESCTPLPGYQSGLGSRPVAGGVDVLHRPGPSEVTFERHARRAPQPSSLQALVAPGPGQAIAHAMTDSATAIVMQSADGAPQRLLLWNDGELPITNSLLPAADALHATADATADADQGAAFALDAGVHAEFLRFAPDGSQARWTSADDDDIAMQLVDAADGRHRLVLGGSSVRLLALDRQAGVAWEHGIAASLGGTGRVAMLADATSLLAYGPGQDSGCRVRRVQPDGAGAGDSAVLAAGAPWGAVALDEAAVFGCGSSPNVSFARVDAELGVSAVSMQGCQIEPLRMVALGGERWAVTGRAAGASQVLRVCTFAGDAFLRSADAAFENGVNLLLDQQIALPDAAHGRLHVAVQFRRPDTTVQLEHLVFDADTNAVVRHRLHAFAFSGGLRAMAGPDHRGRFAYLLEDLADGSADRVELAAPGGVPRWSVPLQLPVLAPRMVLANGRVLVGGGVASDFSQVAFRSAEVIPDLVFDGGFE